MIYDFNQLVHLRRDPSHYGRIRRGSWLAEAIGSDSRQFVQWEQDGASHTTHESVDDLMSADEYRERRRLFFAAMRQPEMKVLRLAFRYLEFDKGIDWRGIQALEIYPYGYRKESCMVVAEKYILVCLDAHKPGLTYEDFFFVWLHQEGDRACQCECCEVDRALRV